MDITEKMIEFVRMHANDDANALRLKCSGKKINNQDFDIDFALIQIEARRKSRTKLPFFLSHPDFIFPTLLSAEQASNDAVARFHASLIPSSSRLLDLTAGLGIDDMTFAMNGVDVTACEIDSIKCEALLHNARVMAVSDKLSVVLDDSIDFVCSNCGKFDIVFADPARRNESGGKLHALSDCQPDIQSALKDILSISPRLLVKSSPLLDLSLILDTVNDLHHIYVVCFKGECKEILIDVQNASSFSGVTVVDIDRDGEISRFHTDFNSYSTGLRVAMCDRNKAGDYMYLYEPNAGIMKTGAWSSLLKKFPDLSKADVNTHIFLSDVLYSDFPGRVMQIHSEPDKKYLKALKGKKINVVSRNHPLSAPQIFKKFSLTPGSDNFLYAINYDRTPTLLIASPIKSNLNEPRKRI